MCTVHFSPRSTTTSVSIVPNGEILMKQLLGKGVDEVEIDWNGILSTALPVEDDVIFLVDAYRELDTFLAGNLDCHNVFLGDGRVQLTARQEEGQVAVYLAHAPYLDRRLSQRYEIRVTRDEYRAAWNGLLGDVCSL
jgi:hypothetical protein